MMIEVPSNPFGMRLYYICIQLSGEIRVGTMFLWPRLTHWIWVAFFNTRTRTNTWCPFYLECYKNHSISLNVCVSVRVWPHWCWSRWVISTHVWLILTIEQMKNWTQADTAGHLCQKHFENKLNGKENSSDNRKHHDQW